MDTTTIIIIGIVLVVIILVCMFFSYNNREVTLRKEVDAQKGKIESVHDKMWKIIKQKANITEQYRETFEKIYPELISGRYSNDQGGMMKWIQEANPNFDTSLLKDLMQSIEIQREHLNTAQTRMLDIIKERETLIENYPSMWFIQNKTKIEYEVISSTRSKTIIDTRIDDDIDMFSK